MLSEWAKRDWDAAWQWALSGEKTRLNDLTEVIRDAAFNTTTDKIARYVAKLATLPHRPADDNYREAWRILMNQNDPNLINSTLSQMPGDRQTHLNGMIASLIGDGGQTIEDFRRSFFSQMTPAERIAAFQSDEVRKKSYSIENVTSMLRDLGHSDTEIKRILTAQPRD